MEPWPQYHKYVTLEKMAFGVFLGLILSILLHSIIAINHHIIYKSWGTSDVIEPTFQFEGLHKKFGEVWHYLALCLCATHEKSSASCLGCAPRLLEKYTEGWLCLHRGPLYMHCALKTSSNLAPNMHKAHSIPCNVSLITWFSQWIWFLVETCI